MDLTLDQALQKGVEAHRAGKVQDADRYYTAILNARPKHPDANHNMGVLAVDVGKLEASLQFFKTALEANPAKAQYWLSYIDAFIQLDRLEDAKAVFNQAKNKGARGHRFEKLEARLNISSGGVKTDTLEDVSTQSNILDELKLDKAIKIAKQKAKDGLIEDSKKIYRDILKKFPKNKKAIDGIKTLTSGTSAKTSRIVDPPGVHLKDLVNLYARGQYQQALNQASQLLKQFPTSARLYNILGAVNKSLGMLEDAIEAFNKALSINPDDAAAYNNKGSVLKEQGKLDEAIEAYYQALFIKPNFEEAYFNMGNALKEQGKQEDAIEAYNEAISIKPNFEDCYYNLASALKGTIFQKQNIELQKTIFHLLDKKNYVRPKDVAGAIISLLKCEPSLKKSLQLNNVEEIENLIDVIADLSRLPLLMKLMSICPLPDLGLENLFRKLRANLLESISDLTRSPELLKVQSALAIQCFTNEYIYSHTEFENKILKSLDGSISKALKNKEQPSPNAVLALASYKALNQYDWCNLLDVTDDIKEVYRRQVEEPAEEEKLKHNLPVLEEITNSVSLEVREQYEESPYPRWVKIGLPSKRFSIEEVFDKIDLKLYDNKVTEIENPHILVAGCGTGQHSIGTSARFKSSKVLAIDLSLSSLAYAKRKTVDLGIENIEYMQADILDLSKIGRQFDIIESAGVLHHMNDPMAGWKVLTDCLKPGGLMKIGLYSELARQHVVKIRQEIRELGIGSSNLEMRSFRDRVIGSDKVYHKKILMFPDFYTMSELRDLLFHVQEHRFTIPELKQCLKELGLKFCGFEQMETAQHFQQINKHKEDLYDLDKWQAFEEANPRSFAGMYQFWCQKV